MGMMFQSHGHSKGRLRTKIEESTQTRSFETAARPATNDVAVDEMADFGYYFPPSDNHTDYLPEANQTVADLDELGNQMIDESVFNDVDATPDSQLPPVMTYWGQFLDHELTARTDREGDITSIEYPQPSHTSAEIEHSLKNARTPYLDLDSVYGGLPVGPDLPVDVATLISGMRHPDFPAKMRVGTTHLQGEIPDNLDPHRDLPRYSQVEPEVRQAALNLARQSMGEEDFMKFEENLDKRAIIGDMRNDENLIVAQFHLSFLRFHNRVVDYLEENNTGWIADFHSAQVLTRLHYQWLAVHGYLRQICNSAIVDKVLAENAASFFQFRAEHMIRNPGAKLGNAMPLEFSAAIYRFGHTQVRNIYDFNESFGRGAKFLPNAPFNLLFAFTGGGGFQPQGAPTGTPTLPQNWIIDWRRFVGVEPHDASDGQPARFARKLDTQLAPPLGDMVKEGNDHPEGSDVRAMFKHLARRNLRRGYNLRLPTGQALHKYLKSQGVVDSDPIADIGGLFNGKPGLQSFLRCSQSKLHEQTPLWFYCLAEAEAGGGETLGELGSWIVASTFAGVLLSDPQSALSRGFEPGHSPLKMPDGSAIDSIAKWMEFAKVMPGDGVAPGTVKKAERAIPA